MLGRIREEGCGEETVSVSARWNPHGPLGLPPGSLWVGPRCRSLLVLLSEEKDKFSYYPCCLASKAAIFFSFAASLRSLSTSDRPGDLSLVADPRKHIRCQGGAPMKWWGRYGDPWLGPIFAQTQSFAQHPAARTPSAPRGLCISSVRESQGFSGLNILHFA